MTFKGLSGALAGAVFLFAGMMPAQAAIIGVTASGDFRPAPNYYPPSGFRARTPWQLAFGFDSTTPGISFPPDTAFVDPMTSVSLRIGGEAFRWTKELKDSSVVRYQPAVPGPNDLVDLLAFQFQFACGSLCRTGGANEFLLATLLFVTPLDTLGTLDALPDSGGALQALLAPALDRLLLLDVIDFGVPSEGPAPPAGVGRVRAVSVPEPGTLALFGIGLLAVAATRRRSAVVRQSAA